jgi:hypothetical protein
MPAPTSWAAALCCVGLAALPQTASLEYLSFYGANVTRLALSPLIVYTVYSAWTKLLGGVAIGWNLLRSTSG